MTAGQAKADERRNAIEPSPMLSLIDNEEEDADPSELDEFFSNFDWI